MDVIFVQGSDVEICQVFQDVNNGNPMNPQQKRTATIGKFSDYIRMWSNLRVSNKDKLPLFHINETKKKDEYMNVPVDGMYINIKNKSQQLDEFFVKTISGFQRHKIYQTV